MSLQKRRGVISVVAAEVAGLGVDVLLGTLEQRRLQREIAVIGAYLETDPAAGWMEEAPIRSPQNVRRQAEVPVIMPAVEDVHAAIDGVHRRPDVVLVGDRRRQQKRTFD